MIGECLQKKGGCEKKTNTSKDEGWKIVLLREQKQ